MRVAVIEPYLGGSHRAWAEGYRDHSSSDVEVVGLPARHWKWRMHGGHVSLADRLVGAAAAGPFDALLVSSMTNVPALLATVRRSSGDPAVVLYVHENQLTYPLRAGAREDLTYAMVNWSSMLVADVVVFNSAFHRDDWFAALVAFLSRMPDDSHLHLVDQVRAHSTVLPVGVDVAGIRAVPRARHDRPRVLWNQRWEYDQAPDAFVDAAVPVVHELDAELLLLGARSDPPADALRRVRDRAGDRIVVDGFVDRDRYVRALRSADVVVSTAEHEFFGIAIAEAIAAGAVPVVPDRVVFPERVPAELHDRCLYRSPEDLADRLRRAVRGGLLTGPERTRLSASVDRLDWSVVAPAYDAVLAAAVERRG